MTTTLPSEIAPLADGLRLAAFDADHLPGALQLSQGEGWPHRAEDWALTLSASQGVVALADGEVVGTALCSAFGDVAMLNMIIVSKAMRGRGLGRRLMAEGIALGGVREMRLTATEAGLPLYEKCGFRVFGHIAQHQGIARATVPDLPVAAGGDVARLVALDRVATGMDREALLRKSAAQGVVLEAEGGMALLRVFGHGKLVGPVIASDEATARALIAEAASRTQDGFLRVDLREEHGLLDFATTLGLARVGTGTVMAFQARPRPPGDFTAHALISQALG